MNYEEVLDFIYNSLPMYQRVGKAAYKANLDNTISLDNHFGNPHLKFKSIHVAGTNGKGSVSHSIASILQEAGFKTGLYTSPHLIDYRERIRINGEMISKDFVCDFINSNKDIIKELTPSFFEMSVAMAFDYFEKEDIDVAVIEVGLGGRLDSTNIINPDLSIITNIGLDHTQFLGNTIEIITVEKAGIIKSNTPVIIGETQEKTKQIFIDKAKENNSEIRFADNIYKVLKANNNRYTIKLETGIQEIEFDLLGKYQQSNLPTILASSDKLVELGYNISKENIKDGLKSVVSNTHLRGRWEILKKEPFVVCDTGHNAEGLIHTIEQIKSHSNSKLHIVLGFVNDKNVEDVLSLFPKNAEYYFTQASVPRAMDKDLLFEIAQKLEFKGSSYRDVLTAYNEALKNAGNYDLIFIGGSTFVVGDLLNGLQN